MPTAASLCSGYGGDLLAVDSVIAGVRVCWVAETDPAASLVLAERWPGVANHGLPTPSAGNFNDGESVESWTARRDRLLAQGVNGNGMGTPLGIAVQFLPTPAARDWKSSAASEQTHDRNARPLNEVVRRNLLPTPRATDGTKGGPSQAGSSGDLMLPSAVQPDGWGAYGPAVARWATITGRPAPDPTEPGRKGQPRLAPRFVEWMLGLPAGWVTSVPGVSRTAALTMLGNGQVPQCAAAALRALLTTDVRKGATA